MMMEKTPDPEQVTAVKDFMMFISDKVSHTTADFIHTMHCSPEEIGVLYMLDQQSPLAVKEIAQRLHHVSLSKLTRVLDHLEEHACVIRKLNPTDRRSFYITSTPKGHTIVETLTGHMEAQVRGILKALTPTERLVFIELLSKIQANWESANHEEAKLAEY